MENKFLYPEGFQKQEGLQIDFKRITFRAIRYWYLVALSLLIAFAVAFVKNRYTTPVYPVTGSIIIKETEETGGAELLYKNALIDPYRNYFNEIYILKSYPLIQKVVEDVNLEINFFREGRILSLDAYATAPVEGKILKKQSNDSQVFSFRILDEHTFELESQGSGEGAVYRFGEPFQVKGYELLITPKKDNHILSYQGKDYRMVIRDPYQVARSYASRLNVEWAEEGSSVVNLTLNGAVPEKEVDFLNGLISHYQQNDLERKNRAATRTIDFISKELSGIKDSLRFFEIELERFKDKNVTTNLEGEALRLYQKLEEFELQKTEIIVSENYYKYLDKYITESKDLDQVILPSSMGISDPILSNLVSKMVDLQLEAKMFLQSEKSQNPLIAEKTKRIGQIRNDIVESVNSLRSTDKIKMDYLSSQISGLEKQLARLPVAERQLVSIERNYNLLENLYVFLMQKMAEAGISKAANTSDIIVVNPPDVSGGPISPRKAQNYYIALGLGLLIPFGLFVLLEIFNNKIQSREDVEKITDIPFIGGIGHKKREDNLVVNKSPKSAVAESFRALRSNLNYFTGNQDRKVFLVTSSLSGEGKTFTSVNLATVLAVSGKRTVLIGADMRRPRIFGDFNLVNDFGLSSYLSGLQPLEQVVQSTFIENLYLLPGGPVPPNPSELLLTDRVSGLFETLKEKFDYIILDTPPVALVTDAFVLSKFADHTIFVVRQDYTPKNVLRTIHDYYKDGRIKNMSLVLNDIFRSGPGYGYGYGYAYGYGYGYGYGSLKNEGYYSED